MYSSVVATWQVASQKAWFIALCAIAVRIAMMAMFALPKPLTTTEYQWHWGYEQVAVATSIAEGNGYSDPFVRQDQALPWAAQSTGATAWCGAVFPLLLGGLIQATDGPNHITALGLALINVLLSASIAVGLLRLGAGLGRKSLGRAAAWCWVFYPTAAYVALTSVWDSTLVGAGMVWFLVLLLQRSAAVEAGDLSLKRALAPVGVALGTLLLLNPSCLALVPGGLVYLLQRFRGRVWSSVLWVAVPALCVSLPWSIRNQIQLGTLSPKANFGVELMVGNNHEADGGFHPWIHPAYNSVEHRKYQELGELAYGQLCTQRAVSWIRANPMDFARLTALRTRNFWFGLSPFELITLRSGTQKDRDWQGWIKWALYAALGALALMGAIRHRDQRAGRALLVGAMVCFPLVYSITHVLERYRHPLEPIMLFLAVSALLSLPPGASRVQRNAGTR